MRKGFCAFVLGMAACHSAAERSRPATGTTAMHSAAPSSIQSAAFKVASPPNFKAVPGAQTIEVRLHGIAAAGSVMVSPSAVAVAVDGQQVTAQLVAGQIDLGDTGQAWRVATFTLPGSALAVSISLTLAPQGTVVENGTSQSLDLHGLPMTFPADPSLLRTNNKVDIELDLSRSIVAQNGSDVLLPDLTIQY